MNKLLILGLSAILCGGCVMDVAESAGVKYADEYDLSVSLCGNGKQVRAGLSVAGNPLTLGGKTYRRGFGTHPESAVGFRLNGKATAFDAIVGMDADCKAVPNRSNRQAGAIFRVWRDGEIAWDSGIVRERDKPKTVHVDLKGAKELVLETASYAPWCAFEASHADWADARISHEAGAEIASFDDPALVEQLGILTPPEKDEPQFNGADIWGVRPGHPVLFRVPVSGVRPMTFSAQNLPAGVTLDGKGVLRGTAPAQAGDYDIVVTAENAAGIASRTIRLAVGSTICLTPPMGWNSWNTLCYRLTAQKAKDAALAMEKSGLGDYGWAYVNLDDWWEMNNSGLERVAMRKNDFGGREDVIGPARDAAGKILPNRSFPDMKDLADYIHGFGFKAGLYSSPGPRTCGGCEGSYGHEAQDAASWAEWGFDYVKYDWCSYDDVIVDGSRKGRHWWDDPAWTMRRTPSKEKPYLLMRDCLRRQNRDIVYSFCQYGMGKAEEWVREAGANCWRSWGDLKDGWTWMELAVESRINGEYWKCSGPGCWADPDMMIIGQQHSFGFDHPTFLTPNEQYTHVTIWAMISAPLLIGCDLTAIDAFTRSLLVNDEVIAISQDRLGKAARRVRHDDRSSVWARPLANGDVAVALVNRYPFAREVAVQFVEIGISGEYGVRDCWRQKDEGLFSTSYVATVPAHGTKLIRLKPVGCSKCR